MENGNNRTLYIGVYEKWIAGYEGLYSVDTEGTIYNWNYYGTGKKKLMKPCDNGRGYKQVNLYKDKKNKRHYIHRLVAMAFLPNPQNKAEVNHRSGDKTANNVLNLEWSTRKENIRHAILTGLCDERIKSSSKPVLQINKNNGKVIREFKSSHEVENQLGLSHTSIGNCCNNKRSYYTAGGFIWCFKEDRAIHEGKSKYKLIVQINKETREPIAEFNTPTEAERKTGICSNSIRSCLKGKLKTAGGYSWRFKEQEEQTA